jgi:hypothetical protein
VVYPPSLNAVTNFASVVTCCRRVSIGTPDQCVSNFDQLVTQWMSTVISSCGSAENCCHVQRCSVSTWPWMAKFHRSRSDRGVGPADKTGKPSPVSYCPGGSLPGGAVRRRPANPREMNDTTSSFRQDRTHGREVGRWPGF